MEIEKARLITNCPKCGNEILIDKVWYPGGCNDYGSFEVECLECHKVFDIFIGRDIDASSVISGAKELKKKYRDF